MLKKLYNFLFKKNPIKEFKKRGGKIGTGCALYGVNFDYNFSFLIEVGNNVRMSFGVTIVAHDALVQDCINGYTKIGKVIIEDNVIVGCNTTILPNVHIGKNSIIGAGSVVCKDVEPGIVVAGNPAKYICTVDELKNKYQELFNNNPHYDLKPNQMTIQDKYRISKEISRIGFTK